MVHNIRFCLIVSLLTMTILISSVSLFIGTRLVNKLIEDDEISRIYVDLNTARAIYSDIGKNIDTGISIASLSQEWSKNNLDQDTLKLSSYIEGIAEILDLDFAGFVKNNATTLYRLGINNTDNNKFNINPVASLSLEKKSSVSGTVVLSRDNLKAENPELAEFTRIEIIETPESIEREDVEETSALAIVSACPVYNNNLFVGVIYGGIVLNWSTEIVDRISKIVFQEGTYKGQSIGTSTIFLRDLRVSTNVMTEDNIPAVGTQISGAVNQKVLIEGGTWMDRAFVVNDWYMTAYEPIIDIYGDIIGIISVGVLEVKYAKFKRDTLFIFIVITITGIIIALILGYLLAGRVLQPVYDLIEVSKKVSKGDLSPGINKISRGELGYLQQTFMEMISAFRERDIYQKEENERRLMISERQASVGRLAAGVAHEINNPLTGVLTFTHMLLRRKDLDNEMRSDLETIASATDRVREIVKGLLDFSCQNKLKLELIDINQVIEETISLIGNQALVKQVFFCFDPGLDIPMKILDRSQFKSVLMNIIINAIDATDSGGNITISTRYNLETQNGKHKEIEIIISDSGCGIPLNQLDRLFDPFFTTKEVGKGTGLGLSVSYGIIEHHGGTISVKSQVGKGSTFIIHLPLELHDE